VEQTAGDGGKGFARECRHGKPMLTPARIADTGFVVVDATWGTIRPLALADGVATVGELEVIEQLECAATPDAVEALLAAGYPAGALAYYRGGLHDWQTLGLPVTPGFARSAAGEG